MPICETRRRCPNINLASVYVYQGTDNTRDTGEIERAQRCDLRSEPSRDLLPKRKGGGMAVLSYPGVYVEEIPSGVRTIAEVSRSDTAFIDVFRRGPVDEPIRLTGLGDFDRIFGGLDRRS